MTAKILQNFNNKKCLICKRKNETLYFHEDPETGEIWVWCTGKCQRGYSIYEYCHEAGISLSEFLKTDLNFTEASTNEVKAMDWPRSFLSLSDRDAQPGVDYIRSRGLRPSDGMYYDSLREGVVFPYYFQNTYVGAQVRFLVPKNTVDNEMWKITTLPGTRLGYLFYGWSQVAFNSIIRYVVVTEGAFNALSIQQALNDHYGGMLKNPFKCIATSGSGVSNHHIETLKGLIENGYKVIAAPDSDQAGLKMLTKMQNAGACTHYALVDVDGKDWNNLLSEGDVNLSEYFVGRIKIS
jgi:hypothetical protein